MAMTTVDVTFTEQRLRVRGRLRALPARRARNIMLKLRKQSSWDRRQLIQPLQLLLTPIPGFEDDEHRSKRAKKAPPWKDWGTVCNRKVKIKTKGEDPSGKIGSHTNPGEVGLEKPIDLELTSALIDLLDREVATIAEVLCRSHVWRTGQEDLREEEGQDTA